MQDSTKAVKGSTKAVNARGKVLTLTLVETKSNSSVPYFSRPPVLIRWHAGGSDRVGSSLLGLG